MAAHDASTGPQRTAHAPASGLLNVDKLRGLTSHDVVARVRRLTGERRVGHTGTLDPLATGVLLLCVGRATRLAEYLMQGDKVYRATVRFGIETETWDAEGEIVTEADARRLSQADIEAALPQFTGIITQTPPMYSALKHEGRTLYRLARQGITIEREPRRVEIASLVVREWRSPDLVLDVSCSKGTYIRALAHDLGQALGTGAYLANLARTAVGPFRIEQAISLDALQQAAAQGRWRDLLLPVETGLAHLPAATVDAETARRLGFGQSVALAIETDETICCAYDTERRLIAIMMPADEPGLWRPRKVLADVT
jgi:tRNA pseudouridine55 synthase